MNRLPIREWAEEDRPREKMLQKGASSLTNAELLSILISSGNHEESAVQLSQRILRSVNNNLVELGKLSVGELSSGFKGIGRAKAVAISAALELGRRRAGSAGMPHDSVRCSRDAYSIFYPMLADLSHEELWIAMTSRAARVIGKVKISQGGANETSADIRLILKAAIQSLAYGIILCHNHPSGNLFPSAEDDALTRRVQSSASLVGITLSDHLILSGNAYYSYADEGKLS
ncbi:MAG: DNA repair protein RadC [Tannerellaceae bacterium]|jgi:DNA repair protein RadC|nr:DNA repair protein RadC [Tannerellaceae bacterium]